MTTFLLEIGTEELPADFAQSALNQLKELVCGDLAKSRLEHGKILCTGTPRRTALLVDDLACFAKDFQEERKGPPLEQAFNDGAPTKAAFGFAKKFDIPIEELEIRDTSKGKFVFAKVVQKGESVVELLPHLISHWISSLQGRRFMRWGDGDRRFSRPIRWIVALYGKELIPFTLNGSDPEIRSSNFSRGHRLHSERVPITSASEYCQILLNQGVHVDRQERASLIQDFVAKASSELNGKEDLSNGLFEELIDLVESPSLIKGEIKKSFLDLPAEVLSTVMRVHQRYIPLYRLDKENNPLALDARKILLPNFLCISNALENAKEVVKKGNERVLSARLSDAKFFVNSDRSVSSLERREQLSNVTFANGLGSLLDRVNRMEWLVEVVINLLDLLDSVEEDSRRATYFCKHDLVSQIVGEFPELQGIMGAKYLLDEGERHNVSLAVLEHYLPRFAADKLPKSEAGAVVALVERFELLLSIFAKGDLPSGSSDPYALRRAGNGILQILWNRNWKLNISELLLNSSKYWSDLFPELDINPQLLNNQLSDFLRQRIISLLEETGIDYDLVQAVAGETLPLSRLLSDTADAQLRARLLMNMRESGQLLDVQAVVTRASRLAEKGDLPINVLGASGVVNSALFEKQCEEDMLHILNSIEPIVKGQSKERYLKIAQGLAAGSKVLSNFFDGEQSVMVMVEDPQIRCNRLNLLGVLRNQACVLGDFNKIVG